MRIKIIGDARFFFITFLHKIRDLIKYHKIKLPYSIENLIEIDSKYLITKDSSIIFSSNKTGFYNIYKYNNGKIEQITSELTDIFSPLLMGNNIIGLTDSFGDEQYKFSNQISEKIETRKFIKFAISAPNGKFLIIQYINDPNLYLLNIIKKQKLSLCRIYNNFHGVDFSNDEKYICVSYDDKLLYHDLIKNKSKILHLSLTGEKRNPYIHKNSIFFVNNSESDYYQIYKASISQRKLAAELIYASNHDLFMPKYYNEYLYFIEVQKSEYLLKRKKINNAEQQSLIKKGVIYRYDFYRPGLITLIYANSHTPKCLSIYDIDKRILSNISGTEIKTEIKYKFVPKSKDLSPAYILLRQSEDKKYKGVILYFHPGLYSDFSPRWDTVLMSLTIAGHIIIAPNYPMSFGYGKKYNTANYFEAVKDMQNWKSKISQEYSQLPLYFLSASSGNILMEDCLEKDDSQVRAACALFGLYKKAFPKINIPILYVLGKNDPIIKYNHRKNVLKENSNIFKVETYENEGHWFRRSENIKNALSNILEHYEKYTYVY